MADEYEIEIQGVARIRSKIGPPHQRLHFERKLRPPVQAGLAGWHRAHSHGAIIGKERAAGIFYAPPEVNLRLQEHGIEQFIREFWSQKAPDVDVYLSTVTEAHHGTEALKSIQYTVEAQRPGQHARRIFTTTIEVDITRGWEKGQYRVLIPPEGTVIHDNLERYLMPIPSRPKVAAGTPRGKGKASEVRPKRYVDPRGVENRGTGRPATTESTRRIAVEPPATPATSRRTEPTSRTRPPAPAPPSGYGAPTPRVSRFRIMARFGLGLAVSLLVELALHTLIRWIFGDANERRYRQRMEELRPVINARMTTELDAPANVQRFEAAPFEQFWFEIKLHEVWRVTRSGIARGEATRSLEGIELRSVRVVDRPGASGRRTVRTTRVWTLMGTSFEERIEEQVDYRPVFQDLTEGQWLAARGHRLALIESSHGVTKQTRLQVIKDYVLFARAFPELSELYQDAWRDYKDELCMAGVKELFTEAELENCRWMRHIKELEEQRATRDRGQFDRLGTRRDEGLLEYIDALR